MSDPRYDFYSNNGYHRIFNNAGLKILNKPIEMPEEALGIGFAELTAPIPVTVARMPIQKMPDVPIYKYEDTIVRLGSGPLDINTFSMAGYYGPEYGE